MHRQSINHTDRTRQPAGQGSRRRSAGQGDRTRSEQVRPQTERRYRTGTVHSLQEEFDTHSQYMAGDAYDPSDYDGYDDEYSTYGSVRHSRSTASHAYKSAQYKNANYEKYDDDEGYVDDARYDSDEEYEDYDDAEYGDAEYDNTDDAAYDAADGDADAETPPSGRSRKRGRDSHRQEKKKKPFFRIILILVLLFAGFAVASTLSKGIHWTVAVFGVDSRDGNLENGTRSDVILIADINQLTGTVKLCSVFRDTYLRIDQDGTYNKINAAYERGGHEQAVQALEDNLDIKIDDYATFNWAAVANGINALGGVDLELSDAEFSYINAFITETVNSTGIGSHQLEHAGMNHLDGVQAVAYGRLRLMDTDFNRTARQRKVLSLALDKAKEASAGQLMELAKAILPQVSTSVGLTDLLPVINTLSRYHIPEDASSGFPFSRQTMNVGKMDCVIPTTLASNVTTLHAFLYNKENYQPSAAVEAISAHIAERTGLTEAGNNAPEAGTGGGIAHKTDTQTAPAAPVETEQVESLPAETESISEEESNADGEGDADAENGESGSEESNESSGESLNVDDTSEESETREESGRENTEEISRPTETEATTPEHAATGAPGSHSGSEVLPEAPTTAAVPETAQPQPGTTEPVVIGPGEGGPGV